MTVSQSPVDQLQSVPFEQLIKEIQAGQHEADLQAVFGEKLAAEMTSMARGRPGMMDAERPLVVLLPGIMGSTLHNTMGQAGRIWIDIPAILSGRLRQLTLNDRAESLDPSVAIQPLDLVASVYLPLRMHLGVFGGCDVQVLPFDWRFPPSLSVERLRSLINGLRASTKRRISLVGHSMGGLVARAYCAAYPDEAGRHLHRVIMLGTPNAGSVETIRNLTVGGWIISLIRRLTRSDSVLDFVRSIPGTYSLLPVPEQGYAGKKRPYPFEPGFDPYRISDYRIDGVSEARLVEAFAALAIAPKELPVETIVIAGVGVTTCFGVQLRFAADETPHFDFDSYLTDEGDGTVLVSSALALPGVESRYVIEGKHSDLPLYPNVRRAILQLVHGDELSELPERFARGMMDAPKSADISQVPTTPAPTELSAATVEAAASRIERNSATPEDIALLTRGW